MEITKVTEHTKEIHGLDEHIKICCICYGKFYGFDNNPEPIKPDLRDKYVWADGCCDKCNYSVVLEARLKRVFS